MIRTALAVVIAVAMIVGAVVVRTRFIENGNEQRTTATAEGFEPVGPRGGALRVACDDMVGDACPEGSDRLDLAGLLDAFAARPIPYDALVAPSVMVDLIAQSRTSRASFDEGRQLLATTPLVLAVAVSRDELLADACGDEVTWSCASDLIREGSLRPAMPDPQEHSDGVAAAASLTGGFLGTATYSTNALGGAAFLDWTDVLMTQTQVSTTPVQQLIQFGGARNDSAVTIEATGLTQVRRAAQNVPDLYWPTPVAWLGVVAVAVNGADQAAVDQIGRRVGERLIQAGWRGPDGAPLGEGPALDPDEDALPGGGTLFTLRDRLS